VTGFTEIARDVFVLRYPVLNVNASLVLGTGAALVVDTLSTPGQAGELLTAVRRLTSAPLVVVNTHHHFDHCFGNATLRPIAVYAHDEAAQLLRRLAAVLPLQVYAQWGAHDPALAGVREVTIRPPDHTVQHQSTVDVGGRTVVLRHLGRGHTGGDLVVDVPDAAVVVAGDLVEEGGPPQFDDAYPLEWPATLAALLELDPVTVVPGHGAPCDPAVVRAQHDELTTLAWLIRDGHADGAPIDKVCAAAPYDPQTSRIAVERGYAELAGTI
jgi:glyoxylase-like metal-dependent hydrolase (beta-lactamase superfamily II)